MNEPVTPRPAATVLLLRDEPLRVLMVKRHAKAFFPSALVFPGGTVDEADSSDDWLAHLAGHEDMTISERALRIAGIRETWEEARLLPCATESCTPAHGIDDLRRVISEGGVRLDLSALVHFGHWITPPQVPKRFDTHFYLARAPLDGEGLCDGGEIVATEWAEPSALIARAAAGDRSIMFSTLMNLHRLQESTTVDEALTAAHNREVRSVMPRRVERNDGTWIEIPHDSGYPLTAVRFGSGGT